MDRKAFIVALLVLVALAFVAATCTAEDGMPPSGPEMSGASDPNQAPTTTRPPSAAAPQTAPPASTGQIASQFGQGEPISEDEMLGVGQISGGDAGLVGATGTVGATGFGGVEYWILYNGMWSSGPAGILHGQQTNTVVSNGQAQNIWSYEEYPGGYEVWKYWGYWYPGTYNAWFFGDSNGWHMIAIYGDRSGWSNPIWINVESHSPYYVDGNPHPGFHYEYEGPGGEEEEGWLDNGELSIHETTNTG